MATGAFRFVRLQRDKQSIWHFNQTAEQHVVNTVHTRASQQTTCVRGSNSHGLWWDSGLGSLMTDSVLSFTDKEYVIVLLYPISHIEALIEY